MIRRWYRERKSETAEYRNLRRGYRRAIRDHMHGRVRNELRKGNILLGTSLGVGGLIVYWGWGEWRNVPIDVVGLLLAALVPPFVYIGLVWLRLRWRARVEVFGVYKRWYDDAHPPSPWRPISELHTDGSGATLRLLPRSGDVIRVARVDCEVHVEGHSSRAKEPVLDSYVTSDNPVQYTYPTDFQNPVWPLGRGRYQVSWNVQYEQGDAHTQGDLLKIPRWGRWWN